MKNAIKYFYNLDVDSIRQVDDKFFLKINQEDYYLKELKELDFDVEKINNLLQNIIYFHLIIRNNNGNLVTNFNNKIYVLMKIRCNNRKIGMQDIYFLNSLYAYVDENNPISRSIELWSKKNDYLEYQVGHLARKYSIINESFAYFIGLSENAIQILKSINNKQVANYISHKRINCDDDLIEFYNPLNIIIDSRIRDASEYFKSCFFKDKLVFEEIDNYINILNSNEKEIFLARMFYPSYYFDIYEKVIEGIVDEKNIINVLSKINDYEILLKRIYNSIRNNYDFISIEWLDNK